MARLLSKDAQELDERRLSSDMEKENVLGKLQGHRWGKL